MKILLCGGGSAGHVNPAIAIGEAIKSQNSNAELLYIGREGGFENTGIKKANINLKTIKIEGIRRKLTVKNLKKLFQSFKAIEEASKIIQDFKPDAVVATGGYVSWPVLKAANKAKIPTYIHESNVYPGLVTRLLAHKCTAVLLNHEETKHNLRKNAKCHVVGNPLRSDFTKISRKKARDEMHIKDNEIFILSFGGSGGAEKLNEVLLSIMKKSTCHTSGVIHMHATGKKYYEKLSKSVPISIRKNNLLPYFDDMPKKLVAADIVICRSGAVTLSELALVGVASILIPSPNVTDNHQYKNAKLLKDNGACIMIEEKNLSEDALIDNLKLLIEDAEAREEMANKIRKFAKNNAAEAAARIILS